MGCEPCKKTSIGGQALIEGIMMRGPHRSVMACRMPDGTISVEDVQFNSVTKKHKILGLPVIRGIVSFVESMVVGYKTMMLSAEKTGMLDELEDDKDKDEVERDESEPAETDEVEAEEAEVDSRPEEEPKKKEDGVLTGIVGVIATVLGVALAIVLFMYLPSKLFDLLNSLEAVNITAFKAPFEVTMKVVIFLIYMIAVSHMKEIKRVFMYHGAEHKSIFCYEKGLELTVEKVREQKRFHPRCGTSFLILMLIVSVVFYQLLLLIPPIRALSSITWLWTCIKLVMLPVICGVGYELIRFCGRHDNWLTRIISAPGMWVQRISTKEPDDSMIEVAIAALSAVIPENAEDDNW